METAIVYCGFIGIMENKMETTIVYCGYKGIMERIMETTIVYWGYMAVVQNSLSGIWPTLAKKCNPFASSFAKLSRSLFSHVGQLGIST